MYYLFFIKNGGTGLRARLHRQGRLYHRPSFCKVGRSIGINKKSMAKTSTSSPFVKGSGEGLGKRGEAELLTVNRVL